MRDGWWLVGKNILLLNDEIIVPCLPISNVRLASNVFFMWLFTLDVLQHANELGSTFGCWWFGCKVTSD